MCFKSEKQLRDFHFFKVYFQGSNLHHPSFASASANGQTLQETLFHQLNTELGTGARLPSFDAKGDGSLIVMNPDWSIKLSCLGHLSAMKMPDVSEATTDMGRPGAGAAGFPTCPFRRLPAGTK